MAQVVSGNQVRLSNGQVTTAQQGGWYDGQQFFNGSLSNPGQIHPESSQPGAGQQVSNQVVAQTNPNNVAYIQQQQQKQAAGDPTIQSAAPAAPATPATNVTGANVTGVNTSGVGVANTTGVPNLVADYQGLIKASGVTDLQDQLTAKTQAFNDAQLKINDNPFLSESNRVGRIQKLTNDYNNDTKSITDQIATKQADNQMQISLEQKQFDINSQAATQALSQFNSLLTSGALNNASGSDIANLTMQTGLSSTMIQSAISATKAKDQQTQVISFDDGTNQGFAVIDPKTGNVISKQVIAASKPTKGSNGVTTDTKDLALEKAQAPQVLLAGAKAGKTLPDMVAYGSSLGVSPQTIYDIYNSVNYYHATSAQQKSDKKQFNVK